MNFSVTYDNLKSQKKTKTSSFPYKMDFLKKKTISGSTQPSP